MVLRVFQEDFKGVSSIKSLSGKSQWCSRAFKKFKKSVSRKF